MKKFLAALGAMIFIGLSALMSTGANITPFTPASGCGEASQLLFCINTLINALNGAGGVVSFGVGGSGSTTSLRSGSTPNPQIPGAVWPLLGPGTGACAAGAATECASQFTPTVLNAQRGTVSFTTPVGAASNSSTLMVMNSLITAGSNCQAALLGVTASAATTTNPGLSADIPGAVFVANLTPTVGIWNGTTNQGALMMRLGNANAYLAISTQTFSIGFWCQ